MRVINDGKFLSNIYITLSWPKCFNAVHEDDAGNARGHVMHEPQASALHDREHYQHHPRAPALKHEGQLSVI